MSERLSRVVHTADRVVAATSRYGYPTGCGLAIDSALRSGSDIELTVGVGVGAASVGIDLLRKAGEKIKRRLENIRK